MGLEFYIKTVLLQRIESSARFQKGDLISILKQTYKVTAVSYAIDYAGTPQRAMRQNIDLIAIK